MSAQHQLKSDIEPDTNARRKKAKAQRRYFTEDNVWKLPVKKIQHYVWDAGTGAARGLAVLVNPTGTKSYFVTYRFPGLTKLNYKKIGRIGEITLEEARAAAIEARRSANKGIDPKADDPRKSDTFEAAWDDYIRQEQKGSRKNSSADETQSFVRKNCLEWKSRPVATLSYRDIETLLSHIRDGDPDKEIKARPSAAARIYAHLRDFFKWCARRGSIKDNPMANMPPPCSGGRSERFYTDDELRIIWEAADMLDKQQGDYLKLMSLTVLRRDELAEAEWSEFDNPDNPTLFTVPTARIKLKASAKKAKKRVYIVPLPPLAQRILRSIKREGDRVFPGLDAKEIKNNLLALRIAVPGDFKLHTFRHSCATYFENKGRSEWERGLLLNHSGGGSVTSGYSHGYPVELKRAMLAEWAEHIERLTTPEGVARLR